MRLFPYHDAAGDLYPELDHREVTAGLLAEYLGVSRETVWKRANAGQFGQSLATGAELRKSRKDRKGHWVFRPSVLWRAKHWGRYAQVGFRPQDLDGRGRIYHCDPAETAKRTQAQPGVPAEIHDLLRQLAGCNLTLSAVVRAFARPANDPIQFPHPQEAQQ